MNMTPRDLYLELLMKILANTIYRDPAINPWRNRKALEPYDAKLRSVGLDWPSIAHSMVGTTRLASLRELAQRALDEGIEGDFIEAGVWRGGCCILMRGVLAANNVTNRKVYVADSFSGLPRPSPHFSADATMDLSSEEILSVPLETVQDNFSRYGLLDEQVVFVKGLFRDSLPTLNAGPFALLRLDGDLYESTYGSLEALYPRLSPGGYIIIDDVNFIPSCQRAVADYRSRMAITAEMYQIDWSASWWRKEF